MEFEHPVELEALTIANSIIMGSLRPKDRKPHEVSGYYLDFFVHPEHYPNGAVVTVQWRTEGGKVVEAPAMHAYEWAEHSMQDFYGDIKLLPDVSALLFAAGKLAYDSREVL